MGRGEGSLEYVLATLCHVEALKDQLKPTRRAKRNKIRVSREVHMQHHTRNGNSTQPGVYKE